MADGEPTSSTSPRGGRRGTRAPRRPARSTAVAFGIIAALLLAAAAASDIAGPPDRTSAAATSASHSAATGTAAPDTGGGVDGGVVPRPPTGAQSDSPTTPPPDPPPTAPAVIGVLLTLDEEMNDLLARGELDGVVQVMAGPVEVAAGACGTSVAGMTPAGGGLVVRLDDPSLNSCLITELTGVEHIVSAEEDMAVTAQG